MILCNNCSDLVTKQQPKPEELGNLLCSSCIKENSKMILCAHCEEKPGVEWGGDPLKAFCRECGTFYRRWIEELYSEACGTVAKRFGY